MKNLMIFWACLCSLVLMSGLTSCNENQKQPEPEIKKEEPLSIDITKKTLSSSPEWFYVRITGGVPPYIVSEVPAKISDKLQKLHINKDNFVEVYWSGFADLYYMDRHFAGDYPIKITDSKGNEVVLNLNVENWYSFYLSMYNHSDIKQVGERTWRMPLDIPKRWLKDSKARPVYFQITTDDFELSTESDGVADYISYKRLDTYPIEVLVNLNKSGACVFRFKDKDTDKIYTFIVDFRIIEG